MLYRISSSFQLISQVPGGSSCAFLALNGTAISSQQTTCMLAVALQHTKVLMRITRPAFTKAHPGANCS